MEISLPTDCGNAPRMGIVGDFAVNWATGHTESVSEWLAEDMTWTLLGVGIYRGPEAAGEVGPAFTPERVNVVSVITHGRVASCDGHLEAGGRRLYFSHVLRFASTSRTARIAEVRSYCIETPGVR
ncbi:MULTISPECIES: nuclear transport factor 2 family protein [unclassified Dietzia]|uniref:nuclear transport factor 2 family protein n=1 Tax=unclassified Dietzia TaxID=2617939 RepID=UPI000D229C13|nr:MULTISPECIES: hypothetical protein [unclassified Dietzia]AVZ38925.1 hypothetical protein CT688_04955 [Dietzia sp. JS16-p6b]QGW24065.1 hypothetical protein GJR88_01599 [Dietzia sp. DQ12-45-1b]